MINELRQKQDFEAWYTKWENARSNGATLSESEALMIENNPVVIPRNHLVEEALNSATIGDMQPLHALMEELNSPYDDASTLQMVPANFDAGYQTFCGT